MSRVLTGKLYLRARNGTELLLTWRDQLAAGVAHLKPHLVCGRGHARGVVRVPVSGARSLGPRCLSVRPVSVLCSSSFYRYRTVRGTLYATWLYYSALRSTLPAAVLSYTTAPVSDFTLSLSLPTQRSATRFSAPAYSQDGSGCDTATRACGPWPTAYVARIPCASRPNRSRPRHTPAHAPTCCGHRESCHRPQACRGRVLHARASGCMRVGMHARHDREEGTS